MKHIILILAALLLAPVAASTGEEPVIRSSKVWNTTRWVSSASTAPYQ